MAAPTAKFTAATTALTVALDGWTWSRPGTAPGVQLALKRCEWDFGDGSPHKIVNQYRGQPVNVGWRPTHTYAAAATYSVSLTVTDENNQTATYTAPVEVHAPPPPNRWFSFSRAGLTVHFAGENGSGSWTFGDGGSTTGTDVSRNYAVPGRYAVTYTVSGVSVTRYVLVWVGAPRLNVSDALTLEIAQDPGEAVPWNRLDNPSGKYSVAGWATPTPGGIVTAGQLRLEYMVTGSTGQQQKVVGQAVRVPPGRFVIVGLEFIGTNAGYIRVDCEILNAAGSVVASQATGYINTPGTVRTTPIKVPATGRFARMVVYHTRSTGNLTSSLTNDHWQWNQSILATCLYQSRVNNLPYQEGQPWVGVLGSAHQIGITRSELDVSTLQAEIFDSALDPAVVPTLRAGAACRMRVATDQGGELVWEPLFTGRLTDIDADYLGADPTGTLPDTTEQLVPNTTMTTDLDTVGLDTLGAHVAAVSHATKGMVIGVSGMPASTAEWGPYVKIPNPGKNAVISVKVRDDTTTDPTYCTQLRIEAFDSSDVSMGNIVLENVGGGSPATTKNMRSGTIGATTTFTYEFQAYAAAQSVNVMFVQQNGSGSTRSWTQAVTDLTVTSSFPAALTPPPKDVRITLTAEDAAAVLAATPQPVSVATMAELPELIESSGVPFTLDGSSTQVPSAVAVANNDKASLLDQIVIARDNDGGVAYVSRAGVLTLRTYGPSADLAHYLTEQSYSGRVAGYSTDRVTNSLAVKWQHIVAGETVEDDYGTYEDAGSIAANGVRRRDVTWTGPDAGFAARAAALLADNATPRRYVSELTLPIRSIADIWQEPVYPSGVPAADWAGKALLELYDTVATKLMGAWVYPYITSIQHTITARQGQQPKWLMTLGFAPEESAPRSIAVPSPPPALTTGALPFGSAGATGPNTQAIPNNAITKVTDSMMTVVATQGGITWDAANDRFVVPKSGIYLFSSAAGWTGNATGVRRNYPFVNGVSAGGATTLVVNNQPFNTQWTTVLKLTAGDTVAFHVYQNSGGALSLINFTGFTVTYLGA
jgi:PKD repeat protein